jgi:hypothetical protein
MRFRMVDGHFGAPDGGTTDENEIESNKSGKIPRANRRKLGQDQEVEAHANACAIGAVQGSGVSG